MVHDCFGRRCGGKLAYLFRSTIVVGLFAALAGGAASPATAQSELDTAIKQFVTAFNAKYSVPGTALGVTKDGKLVSLIGVGLDPSRPMPLGSNSKSVTAVAALQLVALGKLDLEAKLPQVLPKFFGEKLKDPRMAEIKIKYLLTHSAGFGRLGTPADPLSNERRREVTQNKGGVNYVTVADFIKLGASQNLEFAPGSQYGYSNMSYLTLGGVIEAITGRDYWKVAHEDVLKRAGITLPDPEVRFVSQYPYVGMMMTPAQFLKWMEALKPGQTIFPDVDINKAILTPPETFIDADKTVFYNAGWNVRPRPDGTGHMIWHTGSSTGWSGLSDSNSLAIRSDFGVSWFVVSNKNISAEARRELETGTYTLFSEIKTWPDVDLFPAQKL